MSFEYAPEHHTLTATIESKSFGTDLELVVNCHAPEGAVCRLTCEDGCEEFTYDNHSHQLVDGGECQPGVFLDNQDSILDSYDGPEHALVSGPVVLKYHSGDYYVSWSYPVDEPRNTGEDE